MSTPTFLSGFAAKSSSRPIALIVLAFEFLVLTAARSGEVRGAAWSEIDREEGVWTVPASRMKTAREHRVPLCGRALEILDPALAHVVSNKVEADDWAAYLAGASRDSEAGTIS